VTTGFAVTPRLLGQGEIEIAVSPWSDDFNQGVISTQSAATRVRAPLGAWVAKHVPPRYAIIAVGLVVTGLSVHGLIRWAMALG
jgi:hypothetical protein